MILHTFNKPSALEKGQFLVCEGDCVLLLEDGVYLALSLETPCFAIKADVLARGLSDRLPDNVIQIDYSRFVTLAAQATKVVSWF